MKKKIIFDIIKNLQEKQHQYDHCRKVGVTLPDYDIYPNLPDVISYLFPKNKEAYDMFSWWLWDAPHMIEKGRKWKKGLLIDKNKKSINLETPEKLFNYLEDGNK